MSASFLAKLHAAARRGFGTAANDARSPLTAATKELLCKAAREQDIATVRHIITRWPEAINGGAKGDLTPLHCAAAGMDAAQMDWLLARGADKDARDRDGNTPLHYAAQSPQGHGVQKLAGAGAEIDARNNKGETPLYYAVMFERPESVTLLIGAGADEYAASDDGETPRSLAPKDDKQRPGGLPPDAARPDMVAALNAAQKARSEAFAATPVLAQDLTLCAAPAIRKRVKKAT